MRFTPTRIPDVILIEPRVLGDERGYFVDTFREEEFAKATGSVLLWYTGLFFFISVSWRCVLQFM